MSVLTPTVISRFASNLVQCSRLMRNPLEAYGYLRRGHEPEIGSFKFGSLNFRARKGDWVAIREVLVEDEYGCISQLLRGDPAPRVLDLGANIGTFALRTFHDFPLAHVVSVEAAGDTFSILSTNRDLNPAAQWTVFHNGIWREDGPLQLIRRGSSVSHRVTEADGQDAIVGMSLPTLLSRLGWQDIDLIKMDIEGGEEVVVPASADVLRRTRFLMIEIHNDRIDARKVNETLCSVYQHCWRIGDRLTSKPLYVMTNETIEIAGLTRSALV